MLSFFIVIYLYRLVNQLIDGILGWLPKTETMVIGCQDECGIYIYSQVSEQGHWKVIVKKLFESEHFIEGTSDGVVQS